MLGDLPLLSSRAASATACPCVVCASRSMYAVFDVRMAARKQADVQPVPAPVPQPCGSCDAASESRASPTRRPPRDGPRCRDRRATRGRLVPAAAPGSAGTHVPLPASARRGQDQQDAGTQSRRERLPWLSSSAPGLLTRELDRHAPGRGPAGLRLGGSDPSLAAKLVLALGPLELAPGLLRRQAAQLRDLALLLLRRGHRWRRGRRQRRPSAATRRRRRDPADLLPTFSVNHSAPSGPAVIPPGSDRSAR